MTILKLDKQDSKFYYEKHKSHITEDDINLLTTLPFFKEVKRSVFDMNKYWVLGLDGFGIIFFQTFWSIFSKDDFAIIS